MRRRHLRGIILGTDIERPTSALAGALDYVGIGSLLRTPRRAVNCAVARPALIETRPKRDRTSFRDRCGATRSCWTPQSPCAPQALSTIGELRGVGPLPRQVTATRLIAFGCITFDRDQL